MAWMLETGERTRIKWEKLQVGRRRSVKKFETKRILWRAERIHSEWSERGSLE